MIAVMGRIFGRLGRGEELLAVIERRSLTSLSKTVHPAPAIVSSSPIIHDDNVDVDVDVDDDV
jgi:hypothetical protein